MTPTADLAIAGSPIAWLLVVLLALMVLAPGLLPVAGRILGRLARREIGRRLGLPTHPVSRIVLDSLPESPAAGPPPAQRDPPRNEADLLEVQQPELPLTAGRKRTAGPVWTVLLVVGSAVAVLSWYLLHAR